MSTTHAPVVWPAILTPPCSGRHMDHSGDMEASEPRVAATCFTRTVEIGKHPGVMTEIPRYYCRACCPVCGKAKAVAA